MQPKINLCTQKSLIKSFLELKNSPKSAFKKILRSIKKNFCPLHHQRKISPKSTSGDPNNWKSASAWSVDYKNDNFGLVTDRFWPKMAVGFSAVPEIAKIMTWYGYQNDRYGFRITKSERFFQNSIYLVQKCEFKNQKKSISFHSMEK